MAHLQLLLQGALFCILQTAIGISTSAQESAARLTLPPELTSLKSPLAASDAAKYAELYRRTGSVGDLCQTGHLYCDAQAFEAYYEKVLKPDESVEVTDVVVFFRESALFAHHRLTIVDARLQSTAIERNRQTLSSNATVSKYTYLNVSKMPKRAFLPAALARTLPFGTDSAGQLLTTTFNIDKSSALAKESAKTVSLCNDALRQDGTSPLRGEIAVCTTSLESLESLVHSSMFLGPDTAVEALTTDSHLAGTITGQALDVELKASETSRHAVCHNLMYPSSVYFCHYLPNTRVYGVTLRAPDDSIVHSVAMCHLDTNGWNPQHLAFQNLRTVPGQSEACHWVLPGSVTFVPA